MWKYQLAIIASKYLHLLNVLNPNESALFYFKKKNLSLKTKKSFVCHICWFED